MNIDPTKHPNLAPLQAAIDQARAIEVMKRYGCYVLPMEFGDGSFRWLLRTKDAYDFPLAWLLELDNQGAFPTPEAALVAAGEYLDSQQGKDGGE